MKKQYVIPSKDREKEEDARYYASLHCTKYRACMMKITKYNEIMHCRWCTTGVIIKNNYRREMGSFSVKHGEFPVHLPEMSRKS